MAQIPFSLPVPLGAFSLVVTGAFGPSFIVDGAQAFAPGGWATTITIDPQASDIFIANFNVAAPPDARVTFIVGKVCAG